MSKMPGYLQPARKNKYGAKKTTVDGIVFDSKLESERYSFLKTLYTAGIITSLACQIRYDIVVNEQKICRVLPDFCYTLKGGKVIVEDTKGIITPISKLKYKLLKAVHGVEVNIIKKPKEWSH